MKTKKILKLKIIIVLSCLLISSIPLYHASETTKETYNEIETIEKVRQPSLSTVQSYFNLDSTLISLITQTLLSPANDHSKSNALGSGIYQCVNGGKEILKMDDGSFLIGATSFYQYYEMDLYSGEVIQIYQGDPLLLNIDDNGEKKWMEYSPIENNEENILYDELVDLKKTSDGGFIGFGTSFLIDPLGGVPIPLLPFLIKLDENGKKIWTKNYELILEPTNNTFSIMYGFSGVESHDNGYLIAGTQLTINMGNATDINDVNMSIIQNNTEKVGFIIKTDDAGEVLWRKTYDGLGATEITCLDKTKDDAYIATGLTQKTIIWDINDFESKPILLKIDEMGNQEWIQTYSLLDDPLSMGLGMCVRTLENNNYVITGGIGNLFSADNDVFVLKADEQGNEIWSEIYSFGSSCLGVDLTITHDDGFVITGQASSLYLLLLKIDKYGNERWKKMFPGNDIATGYSVIETDDDNILVTGITQTEESVGELTADSEILVIKTRSNGEKIWEKTYAYYQKEPPEINIITPENGLYFLNNNILALDQPIVIGPIDIKITANHCLPVPEGIIGIDLYIDDEHVCYNNTEELQWKWDQLTFGKKTLRFRVLDKISQTAEKEIEVLKLF